MRSIEVAKAEVNAVDVIVPFFRAEQFVLEFMSAFSNLCSSNADFNFKLIAIDDGSDDRTWDLICNYIESRPAFNVEAIKLSRNYGQHPATVAGLRTSKADYIVVMDGDLEDNPSDILLLLEKLRSSDLDIVVASYKNRKSSRNRLLSKVFHKISNRQVYREAPSTFKAFKSHIREKILRYPELSRLSGPVIDSIGFTRANIQIHSQSVKTYGSRYSFVGRLKIGFPFLLSRMPSLPSYLLLFSMFIIFSLLFYALVIIVAFVFDYATLPSGLNQVVLLLLLIFGWLVFVSSILILFLQEILGYVKGAPDYEIQRVINYSRRNF